MKKGQLDLMQTAFFILVLFFIIMMAFLFIMRSYSQGRSTRMEYYLELSQQRAYQITNHLPEIKCIADGVVVMECFDKQKINHFKTKITENNLYYNNLLGTSKITLTIFDEGMPIDDIIYDQSKETYEHMRSISQPVLVYDAESLRYSEGVFTVEIYN